MARVQAGVARDRGVGEHSVLAYLLKMHMAPATKARWAAKERKQGPMTYEMVWDDLEVVFGLNCQAVRRAAWKVLRPTFCGASISRAGRQIYSRISRI